MIHVAIIGAAGLSGLELIRILARHPRVKLEALTSGKYAGQSVGEAFPELSRVTLKFQPHDAVLNGGGSGCEVAFLAVPNQASLEMAPRLLKQGVKVIDLSGVFRLKDVAVFEKRYGLKQTAPDALREAVFGLPEAYRQTLIDFRNA